MKKTESITFRCNPNIKIKLDEMAKEEDRSLSYIVNRILSEALLKGEEVSEEN